MNFGLFIRAAGFSILQNSGIPVSPEQVGIKVKNPGALSGTGPFSQFLSLNRQALQPPKAPVPPADSSDPAAQAKYNEELLAYNNQYQAYNHQLYQMMIRQFQQMQYQQQVQARQSQAAPISRDTDLGVGGILDSESS
jgi:hypothetical protein